MEQKNFEISVPKLDLERNDKLKVFGVVSILKSAPLEELKNSFSLSLLLTYTRAECLLIIPEVLRRDNKNPDDYILDYINVTMPVEQIVNTTTPAVPAQVEKVENGKSLEDNMINNVCQVFEVAGTKEQKRVAMLVIEKFKEFVDKKKVSTGA